MFLEARVTLEERNPGVLAATKNSRNSLQAECSGVERQGLSGPKMWANLSSQDDIFCRESFANHALSYPDTSVQSSRPSLVDSMYKFAFSVQFSR